jgi:nucleoid-associated protein YgaU
MNKSWKIVAVLTFIVLTALVWMMAKSQRTTVETATLVGAVPLQNSEQNARIEPGPLPLAPAAVTAQQPVADPVQPVVEDPSRHVAQPGETVNSLAGDLLGKNDKTNRDAIIDANPSLQRNPDRLLVGKSYHIPSPAAVEAAKDNAAANAVEAQSVELPAAPQPVVQAQPVKVLRYTATSGDTVSTLAGAFLGHEDQTHQDQIIAANPSLKSDPDHIVAGKVYRIPAPDGLSASAASLAPQAVTVPTTQPDADQIVTQGSPRSLRYTARAGDTVSTLAVQLLGSDTQQSRNAIINENPILKANPDRVIAGQTYWIPAPTSVSINP